MRTESLLRQDGLGDIGEEKPRLMDNVHIKQVSPIKPHLLADSPCIALGMSPVR